MKRGTNKSFNLQRGKQFVSARSKWTPCSTLRQQALPQAESGARSRPTRGHRPTQLLGTRPLLPARIWVGGGCVDRVTSGNGSLLESLTFTGMRNKHERASHQLSACCEAQALSALPHQSSPSC